MKTKFFKITVSLLLVILLLTGTIFVSAEQETKTDVAQSIIDGIIEYNLKETGSTSVQHWIDEYLAKNAGSTEWYALTLSQYSSFDFTAYENALSHYLCENKVGSASSRQKYALVLIGIGSGDSFIYNTLCDSIGNQGLLSWVFGLHILNNGYESPDYSLAEVKEKLLSLQHSDGGFSVMGTFGDVDSTAMVIQALSPYYNTDSKVKSAVDSALDFLSLKQKETGDFASYGENNSESTAQVLTALCSLGIDCKSDSRFIKNGNTLFDGINIYKLPDGSFCHKTLEDTNQTATVQVLYSMVSYLRMKEGKSGLYILDGANPAALEIPKVEDDTTSSAQSEPSSVTTESADSSLEQNSQGSSSEELPSASDGASSENTVTNSSSKPSESSENTSTPLPNDDEEKDGTLEEKQNLGYKFWAIIFILFAAVLVFVILLFKSNKNAKNYLLVAAISALLIFLTLITNIQTKSDYYGGADSIQNPVGTVTITIRCDAIEDRSAAHVPDDAVILEVTEIAFEEDATVYDILVNATAKNKIHLETNGTADSAYVQGINNIYEFDFGDLSGWVYYVNGESPSLSCGKYTVKDKDKIEWHYSCNLGKDIG